MGIAIFGGIGLIVVFMFVFVYALERSSKGEEKRTAWESSLTISNVKTRSVSLNGGNEIYVMGEVHNTSEIPLNCIVFEVRLSTKKEDLADYLLLEQSKLLVSGNETSIFRIKGSTMLNADEIEDVQVKALSAKKANKCY
ncbi:MAG: hypothetical protein FWC38_03865 [Proteobacteria bacterium]|nr:hypothetical protein [Pseudomonadota bacterium]MCL2307361.1 hypothetical protein [Pseudomonadota bacterium]